MTAQNSLEKSAASELFPLYSFGVFRHGHEITKKEFQLTDRLILDVGFHLVYNGKKSRPNCLLVIKNI